MDDPYWSRPAGELSATLDSSAAGLTNAEAAARLRRYGSNAIRAESSTSAVRLLLRQFSSPLVLILVFGAFVCLLLQDWVDAAIVLAIVLGSALLGFAQEYRASNAIARLRERLALTTQVRRQGELKTLPSASIVPGDVVMLSAGNLVPADGVVLEARDFLVTEASLTGESLPVEKRPGAVAADAPLSGRSNCVWCGTSVRSGTATILVVRTGERTAFGKVAIRLRERPPETEFVHGLRSFGHLLFQIMIGMVLLVMMVSLLLGRPLVDSLLFAVALAVGLSPELLPAIVSVTQAAGARAMARRGVIVRHLESIENLGSIDILCTDKTGTLTEGVMSLAAAVDPMGRASDEVGRLAFLNAAFETGIDNPLDAALVKAGKAQGLSTQGWRKIDEIPYDFRRKRVTIVASRQDDAGCEIIVKGAFANVLDVCTAVTTDEGDLPLDEALRQQLEDRYRERGTQGLRVLAVATRRAPLKPHFEHADEQGLCFRGFLEFVDPPKEDARQAIQDLLGLGVKLKIVSGDNRYVTAHLAEAVGLRADTMLTGAEIATLNDEALWHRAERADLFVEVDPQQKERIVRALQRTGHAVGYLGDGINDAAALHSADVGISVDQAVDVARESADVVLMRPSLDVLATGIQEGRRTFANTLKYICITTSANFGNMVSMALATSFLPFLPLAAKQILLNNFLSDLPSMLIANDAVDAPLLAAPQRWHERDIRSFMLVFGLISSVFDILTFVLLIQVFDAGERGFQSAWFVVSLLTELAVVLVLRTRGPAWRSAPSRLLAWTTVAVAATALAIPTIGPIAAVFALEPLPPLELAAMLSVVVLYVAATEMAKRRYFGRKRQANMPPSERSWQGASPGSRMAR